MLDLFVPPVIVPRPTRVVLLADREPKRVFARALIPVPIPPKEYQPRGKSKTERKDNSYWSLTDAERAERKKIARQWYLDNRARALAQAKARYEALTPEEKKAYYERNLARARARRAAKKAKAD